MLPARGEGPELWCAGVIALPRALQTQVARSWRRDKRKPEKYFIFSFSGFGEVRTQGKGGECGNGKEFPDYAAPPAPPNLPGWIPPTPALPGPGFLPAYSALKPQFSRPPSGSGDLSAAGLPRWLLGRLASWDPLPDSAKWRERSYPLTRPGSIREGPE